eukprot:2304058-Rhodomonas_salina.3
MVSVFCGGRRVAEGAVRVTEMVSLTVVSESSHCVVSGLLLPPALDFKFAGPTLFCKSRTGGSSTGWAGEHWQSGSDGPGPPPQAECRSQSTAAAPPRMVHLPAPGS